MNLNTFYLQELDKYALDVKKQYKQLSTLSILRLLVFLATIIGVYFTFQYIKITIGILMFGSVIFIYLLTKHTNLKYKHNLKKVLVSINKEEVKIASGKDCYREQGLQYQNPKHPYSLDIDLFGNGSFFQFLNRTATTQGEKALVNELTANTIEDITYRQEAIKELTEKVSWRQNFQAISSLIKVETEVETITNYLKNYKTFLSPVFKFLPIIIAFLSILIFGLAIADFIPIESIGYWLFVGLFFTGFYLKKINLLSANTTKMRDTFRQYASLLKSIENEEFKSELLQKKQSEIQLEEKKASTILKELSKAIDALDNRNNLISAIFGNGYFLTDIKHTLKIENWVVNYKSTVKKWFEVVSFFDAYNSLGNYAFNHPDYVYPEIVSSNKTTKITSLGHPLLKTDKRVDNDFKIKNQQFFIITGANMAGKSTFLRTVSLHIVMANVGLPVSAKSSEYSPVKLITSMRTTDSLTDDTSYFFSELKRLKFIVEAIEKENYFIILDEILKGTNSTDKAIGSRKFVEKLVSKNATGIIATHDLSLTEIEKDLDKVKNHFFDAEIVKNELYFDYTFKPGVSQNMNASFLLKKMNIVE